MKLRYLIPTILLAMMILSGCPGGDYNGQKLGSSTAVDTAPPFVVLTSPLVGATNVSTTAVISATFSEAVNPASVNTSTFTLISSGGPVAGTVSLAGATATFTPSAPLTPGVVYTVTLTTGVTDQAGNPLFSIVSWTFTTAATVDTTPPVVVSVTPTNGASGISIRPTVSAVFDESLNPGSVTGSTFLVSTAGTPVGGTVSLTGGTATFTPLSALSSNTTYSVTLTTGIVNLANLALASPYNWSFTTAPTPTITTSSLPIGTQTGSYNFVLQASDGFGTRTWTSTVLPSGLSLSTAGVLSSSNITAAPGSYPITFTVTDQDGLTASRALSLDIIAGPLVTTSSLDPATVGGTYNLPLSAGGGSGTYVSWSASGLPTGMTFNTSTGDIGGVPTAAGTYNVGFTVTDSTLVTSPINTLSLTVNDAPAVTTLQAALDAAPAIVGQLYTFNMSSSGGTGALTWNAVGLPPSLSVGMANGIINGIPGSGEEGSYSVVFTVTDANLVTSPTTTLLLTVIAAPTISTTSLQAATITGSYSQTISAAGGSGTYVSWSAVNLPPGLSFDTATGAISSVPTATGSYNVDFTVTDSNSLTSLVKTLLLVVNDVPVITTVQADLDAAPATNGSPYTFNMQSSGGTAPLTWAWSSAGSLPPGLNLDPSTGVISGTPSAAGVYNIDFTVSDFNSVISGTVNLNLTVN